MNKIIIFGIFTFLLALYYVMRIRIEIENEKVVYIKESHSVFFEKLKGEDD